MTEFLFAERGRTADAVAIAQGWRPDGRAAWLKPDGETTVYFIRYVEHLDGLAEGDTVYVTADTSRHVQQIIKATGATCVRLTPARLAKTPYRQA